MVHLQASQILVKLVNFYFIFLYYLAGPLEQAGSVEIAIKLWNSVSTENTYRNHGWIYFLIKPGDHAPFEDTRKQVVLVRIICNMQASVIVSVGFCLMFLWFTNKLSSRAVKLTVSSWFACHVLQYFHFQTGWFSLVKLLHFALFCFVFRNCYAHYV